VLRLQQDQQALGSGQVISSKYLVDTKNLTFVMN
jgi:hypothetical protein